MSVWDNEYYEEEPDGYGSEPDPDDPSGILRRDRDAEIAGRQWAKAMGTGYPSPVESSRLVDQGHQNPGGQPEGQEVEPARAGDTEAGENEKHEAED